MLAPLPDASLQFDISHRPDFALLSVQLVAEQQLFSEASAMATMDSHIELKAGLRGGLKRSLGRAFGGESFVISRYRAVGAPGEVTLAPGPPGDIVHYPLRGQRLLLQRGAFLAHSEGIEVTGSWQGARGFFSGEGLVLLQASGHGDLFFNSYGAILPMDVTDDFYVDTGYVVAFEDTLRYQVTTLPGLGIGSRVKSFLFGGEGLVCRFSGQGRVWVQTRTINPFLGWVYPYRPQRRNDS